jgi:hypothetical protein
MSFVNDNATGTILLEKRSSMRFHNTIIITIWKEAIITNLWVGFNHETSNTSIRLLVSQVV